jgi:hypothetical protein
VPALSSAALPAGRADGWFRTGSTIHVLTRHPGVFAALAGTPATAAAPSAVTVSVGGVVSLSHPVIEVDVRAPHEVRLACALSRAGTPVARWSRRVQGATTTALRLRLPPAARKPGRYMLAITAAHGATRRSTVVVVP